MNSLKNDHPENVPLRAIVVVSAVYLAVFSAIMVAQGHDSTELLRMTSALIGLAAVVWTKH